MQKMDTTIYEYEMSNLGASYENPRKETFENYKERKGFKTDKEAIDHLNTWGGSYFIGTQDEYDTLKTPITYYFTELDNEEVRKIESKPIDYLVDGKVDISFDKVLTGYQSPKEKTKIEYDTWQVKVLLSNKIGILKAQSSTKLAAYIAKCEDYIAEHVDDLKAPQLKTFILANGKIDEKALEAAIKANQDKSDSIALLCEAYLSWIVLIEKGTQSGLDELPETDPTKLNDIIDALWKAEHDKERKALIVKLNSSEAEFAIVDKYLVVTQGDEPEIKD